MGRQWLQAKREVANLRKGAVVGKLTKEIAVAAKLGGADPDSNARLFAAVEKARRNSVTRDAIERAIKKGAGIGGEKMVMEHIVFEGYAPHKVALIVEVLTDNNNRTAPEIRNLFKRGQLGAPGSNKFLFEHVGLVEAHTDKLDADAEEAAIEAGANEVEPLSHEQNDDIPGGQEGRAVHHGPEGDGGGVEVALAKRVDGGHERAGLCAEELPGAERRGSRGRG